MAELLLLSCKYRVVKNDSRFGKRHIFFVTKTSLATQKFADGEYVRLYCKYKYTLEKSQQ